MTSITSRIEAGRDATLLLTLRTPAPKSNLRFVDFVAKVVARLKTRRRADYTVNVNDVAADTTDEVMVIVTHAIFITRRRSDRLNSTNQALLYQDGECVIYGLS